MRLQPDADITHYAAKSRSVPGHGGFPVSRKPESPTSVAMSRLSSETLKTMCGQVKEPLGEQIHIAWYCVTADSNRFEDTEEEFIRALHRLGIPDAGRADAGSAQG